jgi:hypothetical protein
MVTPPPPPPEPPPQQPDEFAINVNSLVSRGSRPGFGGRVAGEYRRAKKSATKLPKFFLLIATVLWPLAAFGWGSVRSASQAVGWSYRAEGDVYVRLDGGDWMEGATMRILSGAAMFAGLVHVTMLYGFFALVCLAWWFYAKD